MSLVWKNIWLLYFSVWRVYLLLDGCYIRCFGSSICGLNLYGEYICGFVLLCGEFILYLRGVSLY